MIAEARHAVADAIGGLGIPVHLYPPGAVTPPAAVLVWGSPLYEPRSASRVRVGVDIRLVVSSASGGLSQASLDTLVDETVKALLLAPRILVEEVQTPTLDFDTATLTAVVSTFVGVEMT